MEPATQVIIASAGVIGILGSLLLLVLKKFMPVVVEMIQESIDATNRQTESQREANRQLGKLTEKIEVMLTEMHRHVSDDEVHFDRGEKAEIKERI